jgi:glutamate-1-semialdehyde 2,1-aminomutase
MGFLGRLGRLVWALEPFHRVRDRVWLSMAKHRSLTGHPYAALLLARRLSGYRYDEGQFFSADDAPADVVGRRSSALVRLSAHFGATSPRSIEAGAALKGAVSDVDLVDAYRVPFQFRDVVGRHLPVSNVVTETDGARIRDLDGNWFYDLGGSYGVNMLGPDWYKRNVREAVGAANDVGLNLGAYHPVVTDNVARLRDVSGMDEVSFHMSGTEAVMQAVRLARFHTGRSHVVRFCGAYHGWGDGVQAGAGNPRPVSDIYTLEDMSKRALRVLRTRTDIAAVLVNPIQAMHPNEAPPSDGSLLSNGRSFKFDRTAYAAWLQQLRCVCTARGIALILDEVFLGFRLARGGAQQYFGVRADLVIYGKTLGGGLPVGVVCGRHRWMRRFRDDAPGDLCLARGTFNAHPYVMTAMNGFLRHVDSAEMAALYAALDATWERRSRDLNERLERADLPVRVGALTNVWTTLYTQPGRFHWMFQFYLREAGLMPSWIGSGRFIFSHVLTDEEFEDIATRFVEAAAAMRRDGWWCGPFLSSKRIHRRVALELLRVAIGLPARASTPLAPRDALEGNREAAGA